MGLLGRWRTCVIAARGRLRPPFFARDRRRGFGRARGGAFDGAPALAFANRRSGSHLIRTRRLPFRGRRRPGGIHTWRVARAGGRSRRGWSAGRLPADLGRRRLRFGIAAVALVRLSLKTPAMIGWAGGRRLSWRGTLSRLGWLSRNVAFLAASRNAGRIVSGAFVLSDQPGELHERIGSRRSRRGGGNGHAPGARVRGCRICAGCATISLVRHACPSPFPVCPRHPSRRGPQRDDGRSCPAKVFAPWLIASHPAR